MPAWFAGPIGPLAAVAAKAALIYATALLGLRLAHRRTLAHAVVTLARGQRWVGKLVDHRVRVLVAHGQLRRRQLLGGRRLRPGQPCAMTTRPARATA